MNEEEIIKRHLSNAGKKGQKKLKDKFKTEEEYKKYMSEIASKPRKKKDES